MRYRPIRRNSEYGRVYARGKSYVNPALVLYVLKTRGQKDPRGPDGHQKDRPCRAAQPRPPRDEGGHRRASGLQHRRLRSRRSWPGHDPPPEELAAQRSGGQALAQAGLPDKAKQPGAEAPATGPPASKAGPRSDEPLAGLPERACAPIRFYQRSISPGLGRSCRFSPSLQPVPPWKPSRPMAASKGCCWALAHRPVQSAGRGATLAALGSDARPRALTAEGGSAAQSVVGKLCRHATGCFGVQRRRQTEPTLLEKSTLSSVTLPNCGRAFLLIKKSNASRATGGADGRRI